MKRKIFVWAQIVVAAALFGLVTANILERLPKNEKRAKYIFLMIGDGMGSTHVAATESYLSYKQGKLGGEQLLMTQLPYYGVATNHSADMHATCSAAAATAIACGVKANNGTVGIDANGEYAKSIAFDLHEDGYNIGIITDVTLNQANPAGFYASSNSRGDHYEIAKQIAKSDLEFFAGSGFSALKGDGNMESIDKYLEDNGYSVSWGEEEFMAESVGKDKVVLCQRKNRDKDAEDYMSFGRSADDMTLARMLELGIEFNGTDDPFFIMCEGGTIDWSGHENWTMAMIEDILAFNEAIKVAYDFYLKHPEETLIIVTADHETGGISLGCDTLQWIDWAKLDKQWQESGKQVILDSDQNKALNSECGIGWTSMKHTGGPVPVYAIGKGAEKFMGRMDNTDIKGKILNK